MADEIDVSQAESDFLLSLRLSQRAQYQGQSAKVCVECGDNIPLARRIPTLGPVLFKDNANRDKEVSFCAIASSHYIEQLKNKLALTK